MPAEDRPASETFLQKQLRLKAERDAVTRTSPVPRTAGTAALADDDPRAREWINKALQGKARDLATMPPRSGRNGALNAAAYALGRFAPRWLTEDEIRGALLDACHANGLISEDGLLACENSLESGLSSGMRDPRDPPLDEHSSLTGLVAGPVRIIEAHPTAAHATQPGSADPNAPADPDVPTTWLPLDLTAYVDGTHVAETPTMLKRSDDRFVVYPSRVHWCSGEPEAMKSWLGLLAVAQVLHRGGRAVYLDLEDGPSGIVTRLLAMGVPGDILLTRFHYLAPHEPLRYATRELLEPVIAGAELFVIDACTESLALQQLSPKDDVDVASWLALLPRWATRLGPAVLVLDHVIKDAEHRGRWATGSQHKLAGLDGVAFMLEAVTPGGKGMRGRSRLYVSKDRHGEVRPATIPTSGNRQWLGDLVVDSTGAFVDVVLHPPVEETGEFRPTVLMERVADALTRAGRPLSKTEVVERVKGRAQEVRKALAVLVDDGFVTLEGARGGAPLHQLSKPYPPVEEPS